MSESQIKSRFDAKWYLQQYPDVAAAGIDPWLHYLRFGKTEGRHPCNILALQLEQQLWASTAPQTEQALIQQLTEHADPFEADMARWVLARWFGSYGRWHLVSDLMLPVLQNTLVIAALPEQAPWLLYFEALLQQGDTKGAADILQSVRWPNSTDKQLAAAMLLCNDEQLGCLNQIWLQAGLAAVSYDKPQLQLDTLKAVDVVPESGWLSPLVSVIMPCFNAAKTLATAIRSLQQQSWQKIEIIIVDDASTDNSADVALQYAAKDPRIIVLRQHKNAGAYAARNRALAVAKGRFITTHDCDDWSHPQKIAMQVKALQRQKNAMASLSSWVRCTAELHFSRWRMEEGWIHRNTSSLMFRRKVVKELGYWDLVSVNADTEYLYRIKRAFGVKSVINVLPEVPLAFGRSDAGSLSQTSATHLRTQFGGVRRDYHLSAMQWHSKCNAKQLFMPANPDARAFAVPSAICRGNELQRRSNIQLLLTEKGYFDADWYLRCNPDVAAANMDPIRHFVRYGVMEGRDPAADISVSGLKLVENLCAADDFLQWLASQPNRPQHIIDMPGGANSGEKPVLLCFAHQATEQSFGAERSFLDVLNGLQSQYSIVVCLPHIRNVDYLTALKKLSVRVVITPYYWWRNARQVEPVVQERLTQLMQRLSPVAVYCNTLTLYEPALAAKSLAIPVVTHVRELPQADTELCQLMDATAEQIRQHVVSMSTKLIANSQLVAAYLCAPEKTFCIPNCFDIGDWPAQVFPAGPPYQVAMFSSNLWKKGVRDFVAIARLSHEKKLPLVFNLHGPDNEVVAVLRKEGLPDNLNICGYQADVKNALAKTHIILSLSHFQESFGRSVLEAMMCQRAVIAYDWGAVPELLNQGQGELVPYLDVQAVVNVLDVWCEKPDVMSIYAANARRFAEKYSDRESFAVSLHNVFKDLC